MSVEKMTTLELSRAYITTAAAVAELAGIVAALTERVRVLELRAVGVASSPPCRKNVLTTSRFKKS